MRRAGLLSLLAVAAAWGQPEVALLRSENSREFFRRHYAGCPYLSDGMEYERYVAGWKYVLDKELIPYEVIGDSDVTAEGLAPFKLLILSNAASLTDEQSKTIHHWVIRGGRLLATFGSGYKSTDLDPREADLLKKQKGHTFGLHQLWNDPVTRVFSSFNISSGVDIRITEFEGPTGCLVASSLLSGGILPYGAEANILTQRPETYPRNLAYVQFQGVTDWTRPTPAILVNSDGRGRVVYFAFAPEFIVSLAYVVQPNQSCEINANDFQDRADRAIPLMLCTVNWLLTD